MMMKARVRDHLYHFLSFGRMGGGRWTDIAQILGQFSNHHCLIIHKQKVGYDLNPTLMLFHWGQPCCTRVCVNPMGVIDGNRSKVRR